MNLLNLITEPFKYLFRDNDNSSSPQQFSIKCKNKTFDRSYENKLNFESEKPVLPAQNYKLNICSGVFIPNSNNYCISGVRFVTGMK